VAAAGSILVFRPRSAAVHRRVVEAIRRHPQLSEEMEADHLSDMNDRDGRGTND
jgi:hypothetical protein